jgi:hypothetical protein
MIRLALLERREETGKENGRKAKERDDLRKRRKEKRNTLRCKYKQCTE